MITNYSNIFVWNEIRLRLAQVTDYLLNDLIRKLDLCARKVPPYNNSAQNRFFDTFHSYNTLFHRAKKRFM